MDSSNVVVSSLQVASESWVRFDWVGQQSLYSTNVGQSKETREHSVQARKQLGDLTKQLKRSIKNLEQKSSGGAGSEVVKNCRSTIKAYQEEIDNLTKRCKASESNYTALGGALFGPGAGSSDPAAIIAAAMEQLHVQQQQIQQLVSSTQTMSEEIQKYEQKVQKLEDAAKSDKEKLAAAEKKLASANQQQQSASSAPSSGASAGVSNAEREELVQLRQEVAEYEVEFRSLKNQDITIRKLESKIASIQSSNEEELQTQIDKIQEELAETEGRKAAEALEREAAAERKVQTLELQLKAERAGREAAQSHLLDADDTAGEREAAWEAQRQILVDDTERLRLQLHQATRERDDLRLKYAALETTANRSKGGSAAAGSSNVDGFSSGMGVVGGVGGEANDLFMAERKAYEAEVQDLSHTANALREDLRLKDEAIHVERAKYDEQLDALQTEAENLRSSITVLEAQVASAPSQSLVDSMKRELKILKRLEYNASAFDSEDEDDIDNIDAELEDVDNPEITITADSAAKKTKTQEKGLESILVAKLRRAENELVKERTNKNELVKECDQLKLELQNANNAKKEAEKLVETLEKDLETAISSAATSPKASTPKHKITSVVPQSENPDTLQNILDPSATPAKSASGQDKANNSSANALGQHSVDATSAIPNTPASASALEKAQDDHSVATIIMAQRDRLRTRCETLEAERDSFKRELQIQVQATESLKADNTKLYEKVRYLQNFNKPPTSGGYYGAARRTGGRDLDLEALEQRYEASVDPFKQFSRSERRRKLQEMSPMERMVYIVARTTLGTKEMRTALFFYMIALHLLVFVTTYHWSHSNDCHNYMMRQSEEMAHLPPMIMGIPTNDAIKEGIIQQVDNQNHPNVRLGALGAPPNLDAKDSKTNKEGADDKKRK